MILHKPLPVTVHSHPVVRDTVQQNHRVAVWLWRTHKPGTQEGAIRSRKFHIAEFDLICLRNRSRIALLAGYHRVTVRVQRDPAQTDATEDGARNVNERQNVK